MPLHGPFAYGHSESGTFVAPSVGEVETTASGSGIEQPCVEQLELAGVLLVLQEEMNMSKLKFKSASSQFDRTKSSFFI